MSSATARVAPDLLKAQAILLDTTDRKSAVNRKDLKTYWKSKGDILGSLGVRISNPWEKTAPNIKKKNFLSWLETSQNDYSRGDGVRLQVSLS